MNRQELFNMAYVGLAKQEFVPSRDTSVTFGHCLYRGPNGRKCAIGHCIPDDKYMPAMESEGVVSISKVIQEVAGIEAADIWFADGLQKIHDLSDKDNMRNRLEAFAVENNLSIPEV